ncbi:unnamed protein product, partial [Symbiodinium necroappetens]
MRKRVNGYPSVKRRCDMVSAASKSHVRSGSAPLLKAAQTGRARAAASAEWLGQAQGLEIDGELDGVNLGAEINGKAGHVRQRLSTSLPQGRCLTAPAERGGLSVESESAPKRKQEKKEKAKEKAPPPPRRTPTPSPARSESQKNLSDYEGELSRSPSRPKKRRAAPSGSPERVPPTQFEDYEPAGDGSGWYVYKKTAKWKFHPETGLYFHLKTQVYYTPKESDNRFFRRIDDDDDPLVKKMKQSEEMRRAISKTEFVKFEVEGAQGEDGPARAEDPAPAPKAPEKEEDTRMDGRVNKWDSEKGFGFIMPAGKEEGGEVGKGLFVHRKFIVGSTPTNPINLKEGVKVSFKQGTQDGKPCALEVLMLG